MRNYFTFDNTESRFFGVYINGQGTFSSPARSYNLISIPSRNGDLVGLDTRLENVELTYNAFIYTNFNSNIESLRAFLLSHNGYYKLSDTYHPNEYRMALYQGPLTPDVTQKNDAGQFDLTFICKPQRFLTSGDTVTTVTASTTITNPTKFDSQPLLRVYGTGELEVGGVTITISTASTYTDIDCEMMDCFKGTASKNQYVSFSSNDFPVLVSGSNVITLGAGITKVEITPRWWTV